jgi:hypothetical protein
MSVKAHKLPLQGPRSCPDNARVGDHLVAPPLHHAIAYDLRGAAAHKPRPSWEVIWNPEMPPAS